MSIIDDPMGMPARTSTIYPESFRAVMHGRLKRALTEALGLTQFGINLTTLEPGARSSLRHWHANEDEGVYVLEGELTLVTSAGERTLLAHQVAGFPAGEDDGHCLLNKGDVPATYLEIGTRCKDEDVVYPDVDLKAEKRDGVYRFFHRDGTPYE